jgi:hypothetical protein
LRTLSIIARQMNAVSITSREAITTGASTSAINGAIASAP